VASDKALKGIFWKSQKVPMIGAEDFKSPAAQIFAKTQTQLTEYLRGQRTSFDLPLEADGTDFQKRVWQKLSEIPYGVTRAYKDIAKELGDANASRAVGSANGQNPLSIVVPCHRVISADGTLGGYAGGLDIKTVLLNLEKSKS
jgi:methylated-DNA-[protein]-cysteine S-methyltransferase